MREIILFLICMAFATQLLSANGGGYFRGGVEHAGDITHFEPSGTENIRILDEKLSVLLGPKEANVEVRYLMRNETNKKVKVRFGFPVEESFDHEIGIGGPDGDDKVSVRLQYCQDYVITVGGKEIDAKWEAEKQNEEKPFKGISGWLVSQVTFAAGEEKPVMIRFRSAYPHENWHVSDNTTEDSARFKYRLSTASCWAGYIGSGRITFTPNGIDPTELKVIKPVNRFEKQGDSWVWNFENLEPTLADDLEIEARPEINSFEFADKSVVIRGEKWLSSHSNYKIKASSVLPPEGDFTYHPDKTKSFWDNESWSEGAQGSGIGEWLELTPVIPAPLGAIEIQPGMAKSEELFQANARPRKILVELNDEKRFTANIPDSPDLHYIPISDYKKPVKKIRITFEEVWLGTRFEDLCVSGLRLYVKLNKKPVIEPVR